MASGEVPMFEVHRQGRNGLWTFYGKDNSWKLVIPRNLHGKDWREDLRHGQDLNKRPPPHQPKGKHKRQWGCPYDLWCCGDEYRAGAYFKTPKLKERRNEEQGFWLPGTGDVVSCRECIGYAGKGTPPGKGHDGSKGCLVSRMGDLQGAARKKRKGTTEQSNQALEPNNTTEAPEKQCPFFGDMSDQELDANDSEFNACQRELQSDVMHAPDPPDTVFDGLLELGNETVDELQQPLQPDLPSNMITIDLQESDRNESDAISTVSTGSGQSDGEKLAAMVTETDMNDSTFFNDVDDSTVVNDVDDSTVVNDVDDFTVLQWWLTTAGLI